MFYGNINPEKINEGPFCLIGKSEETTFKSECASYAENWATVLYTTSKLKYSHHVAGSRYKKKKQQSTYVSKFPFFIIARAFVLFYVFLFSRWLMIVYRTTFMMGNSVSFESGDFVHSILCLYETKRSQNGHLNTGRRGSHKESICIMWCIRWQV